MATQKLYAAPCDRCQGRGGWEGWPGYTCYRCGGTGQDPKRRSLTPFRKVVANRQATMDSDYAKYREQGRQDGLNGIAFRGQSTVPMHSLHAYTAGWDEGTRKLKSS